MSASSSSNFAHSSQSQTCVHSNSSATSHPPNDVPVREEPLSIELLPHLLHQSVPQKNWSIRQLDVNNAFFHGYLLEDVYITQSLGFVHPNFLDHAYKLQKALYGLNQAPFNKLSQFMHQPTTAHWVATKRLLHYLKDDRRSTSAYIVFLGHNPISWASKKQRSVARSSTETEYEAIASIASELSWIRSLLMEITISLPQQPTIYCDNPFASLLIEYPKLPTGLAILVGMFLGVATCNSNTIFCGSLTVTLMFEHEEGPVVKEVFLNFGLHGVSEEQIYDIAKEIGDAVGKLLALFLVKIKLMTTVLEWGLHSLEWECLQEQAKQKDEDENEQ
ncbi:Retrovirus-related Pol polyprotein from transposon RE2 [Vitis vinifera]|uniref:Retrovirus-related Pol polyprotein from transposon RE2 n=1 Tax=Vitis vinifera TaxID=29760 RepID=A0A438CMJ4_VITVI|nr:Retrovirus-related Pol polyprotein from transposon RE2 [Vitis vinifera]